jgi:NUBPL iron-transfer P-loop NTPase
MTVKHQNRVATEEKNHPTPTKLIVVHGDKGGVGKSFVAQAIADFLYSKSEPLAIIDADTANPDVSRMFGTVVPCVQTNVRSENGWMDAMDFVLKHPGHTIVMNTPAGIGEHMEKDITSFSRFLAAQDFPVEMELWWAMNAQHDSVNLFNKAYTQYGQFFARTRVVCNLHFANGDKTAQGPFLLWNESQLRTRIENNNGMTLYFPALHIRVVAKIFVPKLIMPFADAVDAVLGEKVGLENSERWKLQQWRADVNSLLTPVLTAVPELLGNAAA